MNSRARDNAATGSMQRLDTIAATVKTCHATFGEMKSGMNPSNAPAKRLCHTPLRRMPSVR